MAQGLRKCLQGSIITSGTSLPWSNGSLNSFGFTAPVAQVGTGSINAFEVVNYTTDLDISKIELNDTANFVQCHEVTITNNGASTVIYNFAVQDAAGIEALQKTNIFSLGVPTLTDLVPIKLVPTVQFSDGDYGIAINAGESKAVQIEFTLPEVAYPQNLPLYSGSILIIGDNGEEISIPYMGLAANLKSEMSSLFDTGFPKVSSGTQNNTLDITQHSNYTFNLAYFLLDFPKLYYALKWGTRELRWDIFDPAYTENMWSYPPVPGKNGYIGAATTNYYFDATNVDPNMTSSFPLFKLPRTLEMRESRYVSEFWWLGTLGNGSDIANGMYRFRVAALVPFGDPTKAGDWDVWKVKGDLPLFGVVRPSNLPEVVR